MKKKIISNIERRIVLNILIKIINKRIYRQALNLEIKIYLTHNNDKFNQVTSSTINKSPIKTKMLMIKVVLI